MVSKSGATCRPENCSSSPVLTIIVIRCGSAIRTRPRRNLAAPTPPASKAIDRFAIMDDGARAIRSPSAVKFAVRGGALNGPPSHLARLFLDHVDRDKFARRSPGFGRDTFLHQGARKIVASRLERYRRAIDPELHPRGL